ncbi:MAG: apolipoprotein N-acyltransferase, partial [Pseudomonadota bacterium]
MRGDEGRIALWLAARSRRQWLALTCLAGALMAMGQAPAGLPFAALAGLVWFFVLIETAPRPALTAWIAATFYFAASMFWIVEPFLVDAARHGVLAPFALIGLSGGLAIFWSAPVWIARRLAPGRFGTAVCLSLSELARGHVLTGFPWGLVGYGWLDTPAMGWTAWIGSFGLTALTFMLGSLGGAAILSNRPRLYGGAFACLLVILIALPLLRAPKPVQDAPS